MIASIIFFEASFPWTGVAHNWIKTGNLSLTLLIISCNTEPVGEVMTPIEVGRNGIDCFLLLSKKPCLFNLFFLE